MSALALAAAVREGRLRAVEAVGEALARINRHDGTVNAFVRHRGEQALREAAALDAARARGEPLPPLAGVPFAVKDNFDLRGEVTTAGSRVNLGRAPAAADALVVQRLRAAGAIPVGATNMDAYAYGCTTENTDFGATFNPRDLARTAGGSSGGSAAAVAAGMVPLALGTDTNGSVRVPAALCGVFGLKPTYGRLPRTGTFAFVHALDHLGCFARGTADLAACYDAMQGGDASDPACDPRAAQPAGAQLALGVQGLRVARLGGYFEQWADEGGTRAVRMAEALLGALPVAHLPQAELARAAAFPTPAASGGALHGAAVHAHYARFEPHSRDRFLAGALTPAAWYVRAQRFRAWFRGQLEALFERFDVLLAPATPVTATLLGQERIDLNGMALPLRPSMGLLTQPISFAGLPVVVAPVAGSGQAPSGVQIIAAPWREDLCLRVAAHLENAAVASAPAAEGFA